MLTVIHYQWQICFNKCRTFSHYRLILNPYVNGGLQPWSFVWDLCRHEIRGWWWWWWWWWLTNWPIDFLSDHLQTFTVQTLVWICIFRLLLCCYNLDIFTTWISDQPFQLQIKGHTHLCQWVISESKSNPSRFAIKPFVPVLLLHKTSNIIKPSSVVNMHRSIGTYVHVQCQ